MTTTTEDKIIDVAVSALRTELTEALSNDDIFSPEFLAERFIYLSGRLDKDGKALVRGLLEGIES